MKQSIVLFVMLAVPTPLVPQGTAPLEAFEAAVVKNAPPPGTGGHHYMMRGGPGTNSPGELYYTSIPLKTILHVAFGAKYFQMVAPSWTENEYYDVVAKLPPGLKRDQFEQLFQHLLTQRLALSVHKERRMIPVYSLVTMKTGKKFDASPEAGSIPAGKQTGPSLTSSGNGGFHLVARNQTMDQLILLLSGRVDRPVVDDTGLDGRFDFTLKYDAEDPAPTGSIPPIAGAMKADPTGLSLALRDQMGLDLVSKRSEFAVVVVDHIDKVPSGN